MSVLVPIKTVPTCKICKHPEREAIESWISRRSNHEEIDGKRVNLQYVLDQMRELGVENPTKENVEVHRRKHCQTVESPEKAAEMAEAEANVEKELQGEALRLITNILGEGWRESGLTPTPEQIGEIHRVLYVYELELRIKSGLSVNITHDHVLKSISETTKRKGEESQTELLRTLGKGIEGAFAALGAKKQAELPPVIEDAEFEEVEA